MRLQKYKYVCKSCGQHFESEELGGDFRYGEFLLRSEGLNNAQYLDAIGDSVFNELSSMLKNNHLLRIKKDTERAKILHSVFGIACDKDMDGSMFQINLEPKCPNCGKRDIAWYESTSFFVEKDIPSVTHMAWNKLSVNEKEELLKKVLKEKFNIG